MGRKREVPAEINEVARRIERWRTTRSKRTRMPEHLWEAAVALAQSYGIYPVARTLRVSYDSLKSRLGAAGAGESAAPRHAGTPFVELKPAMLPLAALHPSGPVVELSTPGGEKLAIRLAASGELDVVALATAFWSRGA